MILVLFSGGLDSMVLCEHVLQRHEAELVTLFYRYPHPASPHEYQSVSEWLRLKHVTGYAGRHIDMDLPLWGADALSIGAGEPGPRVVANRNQVMVSLAINIAASIGAKEVWYGANLDDASDYPDCAPGWVEAMNQLSREWGVAVRAPLLYKAKSEIKDMARDLRVEGWWSCYQPIDGMPCGSCNSCVA
tara:strand:- start:678 stop:1244 length:567 start_codon:yes stop_codon:yes gene_type:complete